MAVRPSPLVERPLPAEVAEIDGLPDSELLSLISAGDLEALAAIYDRHIEALWRVALRCTRDVGDAERAVSATFLRLWREPEPGNRTALSARLELSVMSRSRLPS